MKPRYVAFNGDADGLCAAHHLLFGKEVEVTFITGVKRDIALLKKITQLKDADITVLDVAVEKNRNELNHLLSNNCRILWFDHHKSPDIPTHQNFEGHLDERSDVNTSLLVSNYLGHLNPWTLVGLFGDNLSSVAQRLGAQLSVSEPDLEQLKELGELLNYNAYGESMDDLHFSPVYLMEQMLTFSDPFSFIKDGGVMEVLKKGKDEDIQKALSADNVSDHILVFPAEKWARRVIGIYANLLAKKHPTSPCALLVEKDEGGYVVSVRAPLDGNQNAAAFCQKFPTGGGRAKAAGVNHLESNSLNVFIEEFNRYFEVD